MRSNRESNVARDVNDVRLESSGRRETRPALLGGRTAVVERRTPIAQRLETVLFGLTFLLSVLVLVVSVYRLVGWAAAAGTGSSAHAAIRAAAVFLAAAALFFAFRWCLFFAFSVTARLGHRRRKSTPTEWPYVSILVPCFNESKTIEPALDSLLELDYPRYEILVTNDGSTDDTLRRARRYEGTFGGCVVRVLDKSNGGKWSAHNYGFRHARGELILCVDADSRLDPPALRHLVLRMSDSRVAGVAGQMRVRNRVNAITWLQALEYLMGNGAGRMGQGLFGTVLVVPGPIGLFRRSAMEDVWRRYGLAPQRGGASSFAGPFQGDTFAEDFDLSLAVLCLGDRIVYEPRAVSRTTAPDRQFLLVSQRYRWIRGAMQVLRKLYQRTRRDPQVRTLRLMSWVLGTYLMELFLMPFIYLLGMIFFFVLLFGSTNLVPLLGWYAAFLLLQVSAGAYFVAIHDDELRLLKVAPLYSLYNGFVLTAAWFISAADEIRRRPMRW